LFGHPEVYVLLLPSFACATEIIPVFSRKPMLRPAMIGATIAIGMVSCAVRAHHMFTVGMSASSNIYCAVSSMVVGVPTGIKIFN
jgi:cytochrome c oxidase subunit 1